MAVCEVLRSPLVYVTEFPFVVEVPLLGLWTPFEVPDFRSGEGEAPLVARGGCDEGLVDPSSLRMAVG